MIMKKTLLTLSAAALLFITGCDSDTKSNGNAIDISGKTKQEVFMLHSWELSSWLDSSSQDQVENIEACAKDDFYTFNTTSQVQVNRNTVKCVAGETNDVFPWSMTAPNDTKVSLFTYTWDIASMTGEQIVLRRKYYFNIGGTTVDMFSKVVLKKH
jgi:hypothetical protein